MIKNLKTHEDSFIHIPKSILPALLGVVVLAALGWGIFNLNTDALKSAVLTQLPHQIEKLDFGLFKWIGLALLGISAEILIALCANRIKKLLSGLLWGLLSGLLWGLCEGEDD